MGSAWRAKDPHAGHGNAPKLILAGRLVGALNGRPVVIDADGSGLAVAFASFRQAWPSRRSLKSLLPILGVLKRHGIAVRVKIKGLVSLELLPKPSNLARFFVPGLSHLA